MSDYIYPDAVVYRIDVDDEFYIGSTIDMKERLGQHKSVLKNVCQYKLYKKMRQFNLSFDDVEISIVQRYPCNDIPDLRRREGIYQRELNPTLNDNIAGRTRQEWCEDNTDYMKEYQQKWYDDNKTELLDKQKLYYVENKDTILQYQQEYREKNKEKIQDYMLEYKEKNREILNEKAREKTECQYCKKQMNKSSQYAHRKTCPDRPSSS